MRTFGERLRGLRRERGINQSDFAKVMNISERALQNYETDERDPKGTFIQACAEYFGVTTDYLLGRTDDPHGYAVDNAANNVSPEERRLLQAMRKLPPEKRQEIVDFADFLQSRVVENGREEQSATVEYDETPFTSLGFPREFLEDVALKERPAFITWVAEEFQGVFFHDFDEDNPVEYLRSVMDTILAKWEERKRSQGGNIVK